jgi:alpha-tubulin suppressor-like RCC1 family protein
LESGANHSVGLRADGTLWAWGFGAWGQLGDGSDADRYAPVQVASDADWESISAGGNSSAAVKVDGSLWMWGSNMAGQLGNGLIGMLEYRTVPIRVGADYDWAMVSTGGSSTLALKGDGSLWAWGHNSDGRLGLGDTAERLVPARVGAANDWVYVSANGSTAAALKADGSLWAWGTNDQGAVGDGTWTDRLAPVRVGTANDWTAALARGRWHTLAVSAGGALWTWGNNVCGQLGHGDDGNGTQRNAPTRMGAAGDWAAASGGDLHSLAIKADGSLWAWGDNFLKELGTGPVGNTFIATPVQVGTGFRVPK